MERSLACSRGAGKTRGSRLTRIAGDHIDSETSEDHAVTSMLWKSAGLRLQ
jgi:hypothetical protein